MVFVNNFRQVVLEANLDWQEPDLSYTTEAGSRWMEWEGVSGSFCVEEWPSGGWIDYLVTDEGNEMRGENPSDEQLIGFWRWLYG
jgi:hypothetical protein